MTRPAGALGDWKAIHTRFSRWAESGVWRRMFELLAADADNEYAMIDSTIVRVRQHSAGAQKKDDEDQAIGRSKGGLSTKIHTLVDALGNPLGFFLTPGQAHDLQGRTRCCLTCKPILCSPIKPSMPASASSNLCSPRARQPVIPPKRNRKTPRPFDKDIYKARHLIENFYCRLKQFRAITTRYDKTARNFLAAIHLAAAMVWLN